ncbi:MAG: acyl dehydratase [SAR202 cluster bacterium]|nr:acyl dehydratase [SAR202 cluster bacterium]
MSDAPPRIAGPEHRVTEAQLRRYADASGDRNPLHLDPAFAATTPYGKPIAHGMLVLAFLSEMLTREFGKAWLCGGKLKTRFRAPVFPGDTVTAGGTLRATSDGMAVYDVAVRNQGGAEVITGEASIPLDS